MKELHALVDFENVQPSLAELAKLAPGFTDVWLFHGPHQLKQVQKLAGTPEQVTPVPRSGKGPNALDFQLSFYLGYVAAKHPHAHLVVIANDQGYDPMIEHVHKVLGFTVKRVGFKPKKTPTSKKTAAAKPAPAAKAAAKKAAKKLAPAAKPVPAKKAATAQAPVPAKKAPAKKTVAKKAPVKKAPAKKTAVKKAPVKKAPAKKPAAKSAASAHKAAPPKPTQSAETKEFDRIKKGLAKMGNKRPHKLKPLLRHLESMLGKGSTPAALDALVQKLEQHEVVHIAGDVVLYG